MEFRDRILQQVEQRGRDKLAKEVEARILPFDEIPAFDAHAEYHERCQKDFMRKVVKRVHSKKGAPENPGITAVMNTIFEYLETHDECQYGVAELIAIGGK